MIIERLFILIGSLSSKVFATVVTGTSGILGVIIGEIMTSQFSVAAVSGAFATAIAAVFLVIPRVMEQRRRSRESAAKMQSDLIKGMTDLHEREQNFLKTQLAAERLIITLERESKHNAVNEWNAAVNAYQIVVAQLRAHGIEPEITLHPKSYQDIVGQVDRQIKEINQTRVAEAPGPAAPTSNPAQPA